MPSDRPQGSQHEVPARERSPLLCRSDTSTEAASGLPSSGDCRATPGSAPVVPGSDRHDRRMPLVWWAADTKGMRGRLHSGARRLAQQAQHFQIWIRQVAYGHRRRIALDRHRRQSNAPLRGVALPGVVSGSCPKGAARPSRPISIQATGREMPCTAAFSRKHRRLAFGATLTTFTLPRLPLLDGLSRDMAFFPCKGKGVERACAPHLSRLRPRNEQPLISPG